MTNENDEYFEEESEPEKSLLKGILLSPFVFVISVILTVAGLVIALIATPCAFVVSLFRLSFDFALTAKYAASVFDKIATVVFSLVYESWYRAFHRAD